MLTAKILDKLSIYYDDILHHKHGKAPNLTYGEVIDRIILNKNNHATYMLFPEVSMQTFNRMMRKCFPNVRLNGGNQTWYFYLLSLIEYKYCNGCTKVLPFIDFHKDKTNSSIGLSSICKYCTSIYQAGQYNKYIESHHASYERNKGKILARQQIYKGERAKRIPLWYNLQQKEIENFYLNCPPGYQVDHIIPLKGDLVSGLHVIENLQYLSIEDNLRKGNKFIIR